MTDPLASGHLSFAPPRRRWRRRWLYVGAALLLFIGVPLAFYFYNRYAADQELQEAIAEVDRVDPNWRLDELLDQRPPISPEKNSAQVVIAAHQLLPKNWQEFKVLDRIADVPPPVLLRPDQEAILREELETLAAALVEARKLAEYAQGRYTVTYALLFIDTLYGDLHHARAAGSLLQFDVYVSLHEERQDQAWRSCHALLNAARSIGDEPSLIPILIRNALTLIAVANVERAVGQGEVRPPLLRAMEKALEDEADENLILIGMRGERAGMHRLLTKLEAGTISLRSLESGKTAAPGFLDGIQDFLAMPMVKRSHAWLLRHHTKLVDAATLAGAPKYQELEALNESIDRDLPRNKDLSVARLLAPVFHRVAEAERRTDTLLHCAVAGLAAERFRLQHKRWPKSLNELVKAGFLKEVPIDLFDGQPLRLRHTQDGLVIHSICNWSDSHAKSLDYKGDALDNLQNFDENRVRIEFRLWNPDRRRQPPLPPRPKRDREGVP